MKANSTNVNKYLPDDKKITRRNINTVSYLLKLDGKEPPFHAELVANRWLKYVEDEKQKELAKHLKQQTYTPLYRVCVPFKIDCYAACCDFLVQKFGKFKQVDNHPNIDRFLNKRGYQAICAADIVGDKDVREVTLEHFEEFEEFVNKFKNVLRRHINYHGDYSHMAFNNITDDF